MAEVRLDANKREIIGKKVKVLRREGKLPAVIYGAGIEPTAIVLNRLDATRYLRTATSSTLVYLDVDGEEHTALVRERQYDRIKQEMIHVDFLAVAMNVLLQTSVPIRLVGTAPAVEEFSAVIFTETESLTVEALPRDLPESIEVDISGLHELGDNVSVGDLDLGEGVTVLDSEDTTIAVAITGVTMAEEEEEEELEEEFEEGAEPEVIEKGKREDELEEEA